MTKGKERILLIDDEVAFTRLLKLNLEATGVYEVRVANWGLQGLAAARAFRPDLIFLDVLMPDMGGGDVAAKLKADARTKQIPIVFLTATVLQEEAETASRIGGHAFLLKPVSTKDLIDCVETQLGKDPERPAVNAHEGEPHVGKKKILIVDDEESFCELLKLNLEDNKNYEGLIATSGEEAIELVKQHKPDVVLLDILMPDMGGLECLKRIKALAPDLPVAMVTAVWDAEEGKRALREGAYEYITKPIDLEYLKTAIFLKLFV